jgi:hypothetical protein
MLLAPALARERAPRYDRRAAPRYPCGPQVLCQLTTDLSAEPWLAWVRDVSTQGIGLVVDRRFAPGTPMLVELQTDDGLTCTVTARVVRATAEGDAEWLLGCTLTRDLDDGELAQLL